jgi:hypothetical protein
MEFTTGCSPCAVVAAVTVAVLVAATILTVTLLALPLLLLVLSPLPPFTAFQFTLTAVRGRRSGGSSGNSSPDICGGQW